MRFTAHTSPEGPISRVFSDGHKIENVSGKAPALVYDLIGPLSISNKVGLTIVLHLGFVLLVMEPG